MMEVKAPWLANYGDIPAHLAYFEGTMFELVEAVAQKYPKYIAFDFMGRSTTYAEFVSQVHACAKALKYIGIRPGDKVTICMPNCPQTVVMFYAVNLVGAISNMVHPLSGENGDRDSICGSPTVRGGHHAGPILWQVCCHPRQGRAQPSDHRQDWRCSQPRHEGGLMP